MSKENVYYVLVDIGCIECGEMSTVIGVYKDKQQAELELKENEEVQSENWIGQHEFEIFERELDKTYYPYYRKKV